MATSRSPEERLLIVRKCVEIESKEGCSCLGYLKNCGYISASSTRYNMMNSPLWKNEMDYYLKHHEFEPVEKVVGNYADLSGKGDGYEHAPKKPGQDTKTKKPIPEPIPAPDKETFGDFRTNNKIDLTGAVGRFVWYQGKISATYRGGWIGFAELDKAEAFAREMITAVQYMREAM